ncbi:hypothetical protein [Marinobacterium lutimaris]|uniref:hypothetical protein n=1 Tax=Marinobacterium lutimaris TaxID=568106 RepID=UPI000CDE77A8|nr:hypothetical protein [Marinobacterium lutimaris]
MAINGQLRNMAKLLVIFIFRLLRALKSASLQRAIPPWYPLPWRGFKGMTQVYKNNQFFVGIEC